MADFSERGIVLKRSDYGENNCMLNIFTKKSGIIKAVVYGVKRGKNNSKAASAQFLCYGDYDLYAGRGDAASVNNVNIIDSFLPVSNDIAKLALCAYMAEAVMTILGENNPDERLLGIFLNSVYALAYRDDDIMKVKSAFEIKLMCAEGYAPEMGSCVKCGSEEIAAFDAREGGMVCQECMKDTSKRISASTYRALYYLINCHDKRMLSFNGNDTLIKDIEEISESYLLEQSDSRFRTLDYFKALS